MSAQSPSASSFRELTSLGDLATKYPSIDRAYIDETAGRVVAVPASYGIICDRTGCAARLDALVDSSATSFTGCEFKFTFGLAPIVAPSDLARLRADLPQTPEGRKQALTLMLPAGLDGRSPGTLTGTVATSVEYADGAVAPALLLTCLIADANETPAITRVNMFLGELSAAAHTPIFGKVAVRLDDLYTPPVVATVALNWHWTSGTDEIDVQLSADVFVIVRNAGVLPVLVERIGASHSDGAFTVTDVSTILAGGKQTTVVPPHGVGVSIVAAMVDRTLALTDPIPKTNIRKYLAIYAADVQDATHRLTVNATGIDFVARGIAQLDIQVNLTTLPGLAVPALTLTPGHRIDGVDVLVPIATALSGLPATLAIVVTATDPARNRQREVSNDFLENPLFVLSAATVA